MLQKLLRAKDSQYRHSVERSGEIRGGTYREKIKARIMDNLQKIAEKDYDKNRFEQEMIYYIEKLECQRRKRTVWTTT